MDKLGKESLALFQNGGEGGGLPVYLLLQMFGQPQVFRSHLAPPADHQRGENDDQQKRAVFLRPCAADRFKAVDGQHCPELRDAEEDGPRQLQALEPRSVQQAAEGNANQPKGIEQLKKRDRHAISID